MGLDLGGLFPLGLGSLSLWPVVSVWSALELVAGSGDAILPSGLGAGVCLLLRLEWRVWLRVRIRQRGMVADRPVRSFPAVVARRLRFRVPRRLDLALGGGGTGPHPVLEPGLGGHERPHSGRVDPGSFP